jgi:hypothetical protein
MNIEFIEKIDDRFSLQKSSLFAVLLMVLGLFLPFFSSQSYITGVSDNKNSLHVVAVFWPGSQGPENHLTVFLIFTLLAISFVIISLIVPRLNKKPLLIIGILLCIYGVYALVKESQFSAIINGALQCCGQSAGYFHNGLGFYLSAFSLLLVLISFVCQMILIGEHSVNEPAVSNEFTNTNMTLRCKNGHSFDAKESFCKVCGEPTFIKCGSGHEVKRGAYFCHLCGLKV